MTIVINCHQRLSVRSLLGIGTDLFPRIWGMKALSVLALSTCLVRSRSAPTTVSSGNGMHGVRWVRTGSITLETAVSPLDTGGRKMAPKMARTAKKWPNSRLANFWRRTRYCPTLIIQRGCHSSLISMAMMFSTATELQTPGHGCTTSLNRGIPRREISFLPIVQFNELPWKTG